MTLSRPRSRHTPWCGLLAAGLLAGGLATLPSPESPAAAPSGSHKTDHHPLLEARAVQSTAGTVRNAAALLRGGRGVATLTKAVDGSDASIVLDYGTEVGGQPEFTVTAVSGPVTVKAVYSESLAGLPGGDGGPTSINVPGDPSRVNTYTVSEPGTVLHPLVQGGERFVQITLTTPGTLELSTAGIRSTSYQDRATAGSFRSSDTELNQIWQLGANTVALDMLPAGSQPVVWDVSSAGTTIGYTGVNEYQAGGRWTDYTETFTTKVLTGQAGWTVRGQFKLALDADTDTVSHGTTSFPVGFDVKPDEWYAVTTTVAGADATVSIDGTAVGSFSLPQGSWDDASVGSVGFYNVEGAEARFKDLTVVAGSKTLYASTMRNRSVLQDFDTDTNALDVIVDGGKRDRLLWGGDLSQSGLTVFYTNGQSQYVRGTLRQLGAFTTSAGEIASVLSPTVNIGHSSGDDLVGTGGPGAPVQPGFYSLSYSIHYVGNLYNYFLYTGDRNFLRQQWSVVQRELTYLRADTDAAGLITTDAQNGWDWGPHVLTGEVTEYNVLYFHALQVAAKIATQLDDRASAATYAERAATVKAAINSRLFNRSTGVYDVSDSLTGTYAQDANSIAVLYGVAPEAQREVILAKLAEKLHTSVGTVSNSSSAGGLPVVISPFITGFEVQALFESREARSALDTIRSVWGNMLPGSDTYSGGTWETLGTDGRTQGTGRTLAHAWSSGATHSLSQYVLGVSPTTAGYRTWSLSPQTGDLSWAGGTVPTPHGVIKVHWAKKDGHVTFEVTVPKGTTASLDFGGLRQRLGSGRHRVTV